MNPKKVQATFMNPGASSLLVIFLVLCIAIFATLTLSGAQSDYSFSRELAAHQTAYYSASNQSEHILHELDMFLSETAHKVSDRQHFYSLVADTLDAELQGIPIELKEGSHMPTLSWQIPIDDNQVLLTRVSLEWPYDDATNATGFYRIETWRTITIN